MHPEEAVNLFISRFIGFAKLFVVPALAGKQLDRFRLKAVLRTSFAKIHSLSGRVFV